MDFPKKKDSNIELVTFFKGIAIGMVVAIHTAQPFGLTGWLRIVTDMLLLGCQIFFVLSAFTLCLSFDRKPLTYGHFVKRRMLRLIPGYWLTIFVTQAISYLTLFVLGQDYIGVSHKPLDVLINLLLLNGLTPTAANNSIVRGGWFVGSVVLLYLLFPLLYKIYTIRSAWWNNHRCFLFPLGSLAIGTFILLSIHWIAPTFFFEKKGFLYNSFVNQLPCFALGFSLFELHKNQTKVRCSLIKALVFLAVTIVLFTSNWTYKWMLYPTTFGIAFVYGFLFLQNHTTLNFFSNPIGKLFVSLGKVNFGIYLIHAFFAYEMVGVYMRVFDRFLPTVPSVVPFLMILPVVILLSWFVGKWYETLFNWIDSRTFKRIFK